MSRFGCLVMALVVSMGSVPLSAAVVEKIELPAAFADFALNPLTGDVAAINPETGTCVVWDAASLHADLGKPTHSVTVGIAPASICFKQFGENSYYAIARATESTITIHQASDLSRVAKIETGFRGRPQIAGSQNPLDPYLYITYHSSNEPRCCVVDLRDFSFADLGRRQVSDFVVSADGTVAYQRSPNASRDQLSRRKKCDTRQAWSGIKSC
jgi:hypothetical protein